MNQVDQKILTLLQDRNEEGMRFIFQYYYKDICGVIYSVVKRTDVVDDLAQDMLMRFWNKSSTLNIKTSLKAYLKVMAVREGIGHLRKQKELPADLPESKVIRPEEKLQVAELHDRIQLAIGELPERCQAVFRLSREEELTYKEIAQRLDISPKTVENQMSKALKILRERLREVMYSIFL